MLELIKESDLDTVRHFTMPLRWKRVLRVDGHHPGSRATKRRIFSRDSLFCIRDDVSGEIAGLVSIDDDPEVESIACWSEELQPSAEISRLGVAEKYQNRGIARELLAGAMEELRRRGCKSAHMLVAKDNVKALRSYEKLVFEKVGEYVLQGHDYWCFEKKL